MAYRTQTDKQSERLQAPQSIEVEQAVLGALLKDPEAINRVIDIIMDAGDFYAPKHQMIFQAAVDLYSKSEPVDITTVVSCLQDRGQLDKIGGRVYLVDLVEQVASTGNVASYAKIILEKSVLRRLIATSNEILNSCYAVEMPADELLDRAEANIFNISESRIRQGFVSLKDLAWDVITDINAQQAGDKPLGGLRTGFFDLDEKTLGFHPGDLIIIAGRPSMGKTALALNIAENVGIETNQPKTVGIFSIEMSKEALVLRMLCSLANLNQHTIRSRKLNPSEWIQLTNAGSKLQKAAIFVDDSAMLSPLDLRAKARRLKAQHGLDLIIVDYIQLMHCTTRVENRQQEISLISRNLKSLAKELRVPVVALSQLSRAVEQRGGEKRPQLADLRESGAIEQDADLVLMLYRPEAYLSGVERKDEINRNKLGQAEVIISKQRNGPTGSVDLYFSSELAQFRNLEKHHRELPPGAQPVDDAPPF
jgi:replicative DNA helicase